MTFLRSRERTGSLPLIAVRWESGTSDNHSRKSPTIRGAPLSFLLPCSIVTPASSTPDRHSRWPIRHRPSFLSTPLGLKPETARIISRMWSLNSQSALRAYRLPTKRLAIHNSSNPPCVLGASRGADWLLKRAKQSSLHGRRTLLISLTPFLLTCQLRWRVIMLIERRIEERRRVEIKES